jgi:aspartyl-tRNA(Asn)/glutamyl-tRNA(Gln) amidotransferase subunit C
MKIDENHIQKVARLARLELSDDEKQEFTAQLSDILTYVEKINQLDTGDTAPADHITDISNVLRKDAAGESLKTEDLEKIAPLFRDGHFVVPKVID